MLEGDRSGSRPPLRGATRPGCPSFLGAFAVCAPGRGAHARCIPRPSLAGLPRPALAPARSGWAVSGPLARPSRGFGQPPGAACGPPLAPWPPCRPRCLRGVRLAVWAASLAVCGLPAGVVGLAAAAAACARLRRRRVPPASPCGPCGPWARPRFLPPAGLCGLAPALCAPPRGRGVTAVWL